MTIAPSDRRAPQFGFTHRLVLAREVASLDQADIAEALDVTRQTVSNYERGVTRPSKLQINAWAVATGVDVEWLKTGKSQDDSPRGGNLQPSDYTPQVVTLRSTSPHAALAA